jgi:fumarate hydratase, class II
MHFAIGSQTMRLAIIRALAMVKRAAPEVNRDLGLLSYGICSAIAAAAREIETGRLDGEFPLTVWQTGSGTQTNMNVNEVIANRANEILGAAWGAKYPVHPNDHVNLGQSSNDSFPNRGAHRRGSPNQAGARTDLVRAPSGTAREIGGFCRDRQARSHASQDATPVTLGQEFSGYAAQLEFGLERLEATLPGLYRPAQGGTAVGTGLNAKRGFAEAFAAKIAAITALAPSISYDKAATIAKAAHLNGTSLREGALASGFISAAGFDALVRPEAMLAPND